MSMPHIQSAAAAASNWNRFLHLQNYICTVWKVSYRKIQLSVSLTNLIYCLKFHLRLFPEIGGIKTMHRAGRSGPWPGWPASLCSRDDSEHWHYDFIRGFIVGGKQFSSDLHNPRNKPIQPNSPQVSLRRNWDRRKGKNLFYTFH